VAKALVNISNLSFSGEAARQVLARARSLRHPPSGCGYRFRRLASPHCPRQRTSQGKIFSALLIAATTRLSGRASPRNAGLLWRKKVFAACRVFCSEGGSAARPSLPSFTPSVAGIAMREMVVKVGWVLTSLALVDQGRPLCSVALVCVRFFHSPLIRKAIPA